MANKLSRVNLIIHLFALGHAVATIVLGLFGVPDDILLTLLTIAMIFLIANVYGLPLEVTAALALLCCFAGFWLGTQGAEIIAKADGFVARYSNVITTFLVTEILGWATYFIASRKISRAKS